MKERKIYICEKCGLEIEDDYKAMLDHERNDHIEPKDFQQPQATFCCDDSRYPDFVTVKMRDGAVARYEYCGVSEQPPEKTESPCGNTDSPEEKN